MRTSHRERRHFRALARLAPAIAFTIEKLEPRRMLTASVKALIPSVYTGPAAQTPLGDTITQFKFTTAPFATSASYYRIATDDAADGATTSFYTNPETTLNGADAGMALFDSDGNLLKIGDSDSTPSRPGFERFDVTLQPKTQYILGVFSLAGNGTIDVGVVLPQQTANTTLTLDPATGQASFDADSGENTYNSPADPDYYPLNFLNSKASAAVTVSPLGLDVQSTIGVLLQSPRFQMLQSIPGSTAWQSVGTASGATATINVSPAAGQNLADGTYELSVAPMDFTSPARSYHIDLSADTLAAPSVDGIAPIALGMPSLSSVGQVSLQRASFFTSSSVFSFTAAATGPLSLQVSNPLAGTTLALYDATGQTLLAARGRTTATAYTYTFNATAGTTYRTSLTPASGASVGATLGISQAYTPEAISVVSGAVSKPGLTVGGSAGAKFYRVSLPKGIDALSVRLAPSDATGGNISLRLFNANLLSSPGGNATPGQQINAVFDARTYGADVDVQITSDNAAPIDFAIAAIDVPTTLPASATTSSLDLISGDLSTSASLSAPGQVASAQFWSLNTGTTSAMSVTADAPTLLAQYENQDGVLTLIDFTLPNFAGVAQRTATINPARLAAVAAISARLDGVAGNVQIAVDGAKPIGVGIAMAPEAPPFTTNLRIRTVPLRSSKQRDLWETTFPLNVLSTPTLSIGPANAGGALSLRVLVLDVNNNVLQTITTSAGQKINGMSLSSLTPASVAGQKIRFLVEPIGTNLGDGIYTLEVAANTTDPTPFIVNEASFNKTYAQGTPSIPGGEVVKDVSVDGNFTSSQPYNSTATGVPGSIDIYRFVHGPTPFAVWTEDLDSSVNTNIGLYRSRAGAYDAVPSTSRSLDYFPSDRSMTDARIEMWNTDVEHDTFTAGYEVNAWYVIVKNEQGSQGHYRLHVDNLTGQQTGPGTTPAYFGYGTFNMDLDPRTGNGQYNFAASNDLIRLILPSTVQGNMTVTLSPNAIGIKAYRLDLLDSLGNVLTSPTGSSNSSITFALSGINSTTEYFLRPAITFGSQTTMNISVSVPLGTTNNALKPGNHGSVTNPGSFKVPSEPYDRANQFADGTFVTTSPFLAGASGLLEKVVFWVDQPGIANFTLTNSGTVNNRVLGLWRGGRDSSENFYFTGTLKDFSSAVLPDNSIFVQAYLLPGMYYLTVDGASPGTFTKVTVRAQLPAPFSTLITMDPNSGTIDDGNLNRVDPVLPSPYTLDDGGVTEFRTTFYKAIAPGGSNQGFLSTDLVYNWPPTSNLYDGRADVSITRLGGTPLYYTGPNPEINLDGTNDTLVARVDATDLALPNNEYYVGVNRDRMAPGSPGQQNLHISAEFHVPQSGTPDIVVTGIRFDPANGHTKVTVNIMNVGHATATSFRSKLHFSNGSSDASFTVLGLGPGAPETFSTIWDPTNGTDSVTFTADVDNQIAEKDESNNSKSAVLNKARPVIFTMVLSDPLMDGDATSDVWGRYVSGVLGATSDIIITPTDADGQNDIYETFYTEPGNSGRTYLGPGPDKRTNFDFGSLNPTSSINLNRFSAYVLDQWGLKSDVKYISANVVAKSQFLTTLTFDRTTRLYTLGYDNDLIHYDKSLSDILGFDVPLIGDKRQKFIIHAGAHGTATLNPATPISLPLGSDVDLVALDTTLYSYSWVGSTAINDNFMIGSTLEVSSKLLDVTAAAASFQLRNLELLNIRTPKIPLYSYGIPGVAAVSANFSLGLKAFLSAGVKIGLDPTLIADPLHAPDRVGLMSPTFVQPRIEGSAYISGDVEVLGFDLADLEGRVSLGLSLTVGLDNNDTSKIIPFDQLASHIKFKVDGDLSFGLRSTLWPLGEIWSYNPDPITFPIGGNTVEGIITNDPGLPDPYAPIRALLAGDPLDPSDFNPVVKHGSDLQGAYDLAPAPQLVIDPVSGFGISVQVADSDPGAAQTRGELQFATRADAASAWSALAPIPGANDVSTPVLVATHNPAAPYMVIYQAVNLPGNTQDQTLADRLAARDLRYRTFDGVAWSDEFVLAGDAGGDSDQAVAFAPGGAAVSAWVHNTAAVEMGEDGQYARTAQEIEAAIWDPATQTWTPGAALTTDAIADSQPAIYAEDGKMYVVWIREDGTSNTLMFSTNDGSGWTTPAVLPITGLPAGGKFTSVAMGSETAGRVNVLFNYRVQNGDRSLDSKLYNRPSTSAGFANAATVEVIADKTNFNHLQTTNLPDGSLVASWKQGDGVTNEIFASTLSAGTNAWSKPMQLTQGSTIEQRQSVAAEPDGKLEVLYEIANAGTGDAPAADAPPMVDGVGGTTAAALPELGFVTQLDFPEEKLATVGATATGTATIINRGLATTNVSIEYLRGPLEAPTVVGTRSVRLSPGATFDASFDYPIVDGAELYSIRLSTADPELVGTADNISSYTLTGLPDLQLVSLQLQNASQPPSASNPLVARVRNRSNQALGPFSVDFRQGDELYPQNPWSSIGTVSVPSLAAGADVLVTMPSGVPALSGLYEFSVLADSNQEIDESNETNNRASFRISRQADPGIQPNVFPAYVVNATLLNSSGVNNVQVNFTLFNFPTTAGGSITSGPVTVRLLRSIDDGDFVEVGSQAFASVAPGGIGTQVQFIASGLAGDNRFRVVVEPQSLADDSNPFNNVGEARLQITGLADLAPQNVMLDKSSVTAGDPVTLTVDVANTGIAGASNVLVEVIGHLAPDDGGVVIGSVILPRVDALSLQTIAIPLNTANLAGDYQLTVVVNRTLDVLETTDANNTSAPVSLNVVGVVPGPVPTDKHYQVEGTPGYLLTFNTPIQGLDASDITLSAQSTGLPIANSDLQVDITPDGMQALVRYLADPNGILPDDNYHIEISPGSFMDSVGNLNPTLIADDFFSLTGDANRDRTVNALDFNAVATNYGGPSPLMFAQGDFNYDGIVDSLDFDALAMRFNTSLQPPAPASALSAAKVSAMFATSAPPAQSRAADLFSDDLIDDGVLV